MYRDKQAIFARIAPIGVGTAVFLLIFGLLLSSAVQKSPTFDEQGFITRGLGYLRGENQHMRVGHPLGLNALSAIFLAFDKQVTLPVDDPSWLETSFHHPSELFLWEIGNDVAHVIFLARLPTLYLGMLLTAVTGRWAWEITRSRWAGLLALSLAAFDPNLMAHSRLATTDLGLATGAMLAGFLLWRYWQRPSWPAAALAGVGFGLLQDTKFTAGLFVPLLALVIMVGVAARWREDGRFPIPILAQLIVAYPSAAFLTLWVAYGFQVGTLSDNLPVLPQLGGLTLPLSHHLTQLLDIGGRMQKGTPSFLLGQYSDSGWWYYFPVTFLLKTPLPTLLLLVAALVVAVRGKLGKLGRNTAVTLSTLLIPPLGYFAIALTTDINLGYRHILPVLPFLFVFVAVAISRTSRLQAQNIHFIFPSLLIAWLAVATITLHPHYLAFFNRLAGGPDGGWRYLVDSNLDWGQDLKALKTWMDDNGVDQVWLSYFGEARPDYYGINYTGLDSYPPRLMNPQARPFYPHDPAPGSYAISATNLQGVQFADHDEFAWFRDKEPLTKIGYSIFIYDVAASGPPVDLALGSVQLDEIVPEDFALLGTNDVTPHWFDPASALLWPEAGKSWLVLARDTAVYIPPSLQITRDPLVQNSDYTLYPPQPDAIPAGSMLAEFTDETGMIALQSVQIETETAVPGQIITLHSQWLKQSPPQPVKIFLHLTDVSGNIMAQWDDLGAAWEGWRDGDLLWQIHQLTIPADAPTGIYPLNIGLYHPETGQRWLVDGHDFFNLGTVRIVE